MKVLVVLAFAVVCAAGFEQRQTTAHGYIRKIAIPLAEKIRKHEEAIASQRIVDGSHSQLGQFPYQAGLLSRYQGVSGEGVCGASLVTSNRLITAAHCWYDGRTRASITTVVLGSVNLYSGGVRQDTSTVIMHSRWNPYKLRNDVAIVYLPKPVAFTNVISPIALPSGSEARESFVGETVVASGYGLTSDGDVISRSQVLSHAPLKVITNRVCNSHFPRFITNSNICTSGIRGSSVCKGDSGGPLVVVRNNKKILVGITSFGSPYSCESGTPAAFTRVTSFMNFISKHI